MSKILLAAQIEAAFKKAKTVEEFQALGAQVIASVTEQEATNVFIESEKSAMNSELAHIRSISDLVTERATALEAEMQEANETISQLGEQLSIREENPDAKIIVVINKENYQIIGDNFITVKGKLNAKALSKDKELLLEMIKNGSGAIVKLTEVSPVNNKN